MYYHSIHIYIYIYQGIRVCIFIYIYYQDDTWRHTNTLTVMSGRLYAAKPMSRRRHLESLSLSIYIYIYREREIHVCMHMYIYIYIYMCVLHACQRVFCVSCISTTAQKMTVLVFSVGLYYIMFVQSLFSLSVLLYLLFVYVVCPEDDSPGGLRPRVGDLEAGLAYLSLYV